MGFFFRESDNSIRASEFQDLLARQGKQVLKFMSVPGPNILGGRNKYQKIHITA